MSLFLNSDFLMNKTLKNIMNRLRQAAVFITATGGGGIRKSYVI